ncbi:MAG: hypothetical protein NC548_34490 [Lachnospiraceae bacterium]|nr:hypothetical protein [Lachnospiraceae bacterium]
MNILTHDELVNLLGLNSEEGNNDMIERQLVCFDIGYRVEDLTDFRDRLVDLFGIGGTVTHDRKGRVTKFDVLMECGTLDLSLNGEILELDMDSCGYDVELSSETIQDLYKKLKDNGIITSDKPWYLIRRRYHEI